MKQFFINSLEKIVTVALALGALATLLGGLVTMFSGGHGSFWAGLMIWIVGAINLMIGGGIAFLVIGIHDNTRRCAKALEKIADRQPHITAG